jgi:hypothetical protein
MALGTARWGTEDGKCTVHRKWMTAPADVNTLPRGTNEKVGKNYRYQEAALQIGTDALVYATANEQRGGASEAQSHHRQSGQFLVGLCSACPTLLV